MSEEDERGLGVYVSVPFCRAKCSFCNFASGVSSAERIERYVEALVRGDRRGGGGLRRGWGRSCRGWWIRSTSAEGRRACWSRSSCERMFAALRREFEVTADAEITLEAAPGQIADEVLEEAMRLGVNRVSLGVQSFVDRESAAVGRTHTGRVVSARRLRGCGRRALREVGADLIAGLPYQTAASWRESLEAAVGVGAGRI